MGTIDDRLAPRDRLTLDREAKEGEAALSDDGNAHAEKRERTHRNQNVGQQFLDDDASALGADDSSRLYELALGELDRGGTARRLIGAMPTMPRVIATVRKLRLSDAVMSRASTRDGNDRRLKTKKLMI